MEFEFVSRNDYRLKETEAMKSRLQEKWGDFYEIPEGGTNKLAVKGCAEILKPEDRIFTTICCPVGTGGTLSGLAQSALKHQQILGFPALKQSQFLHEVICTFVKNTNWRLVNEYHFGGYAKINTELIDFINAFKKASGIPLDPIYTGKMMYGIIDMVKKGAIAPGTKVLAIHTGGLQGIRGMNQKLKAKGLPLIQ
jgi:1-aminocyclopropane-1-carboxylate deaminase